MNGMANREIPASQLAADDIAMFSVRSSSNITGSNYYGDLSGDSSVSIHFWWTEDGFSGSSWHCNISPSPFSGYESDASIVNLGEDGIDQAVQNWLNNLPPNTSISEFMDALGSSCSDTVVH